MKDMFDKTKRLLLDAADEIIHPNKTNFVSTGFINLDHGAFKLHRGDLVILAGRPAMGKTSLAISIACRSSTEYGTGVAYYATNMPEQTLAERMLRIQSSRIEQGMKGIADYEVIRKSADTLSNQRIALRYMPIFSMEQMESEVSDSDRIDLLIIDSLDGIKASSEGIPSTGSVELIHRLKEFSKKSNLVTILLSKIGRGPENRTPHIPVITDLTEAKIMTLYADAIWILYHERYYDRSSLDSTASISLAFSKYEESINTILMFDEQSMGFHDMCDKRIRKKVIT